MPSPLDDFVQKIMDIKIARMEGAFAAIAGAISADYDVLYKLKKTTIAFAKSYNKKDAQELGQLSEEINGYLNTLFVMSVLSKQKTDSLLDDLDSLTPKA